MNESLEALIGHQFGNYRLVRVLGSGGFASVYLGENKYIHTLAAVKVLHTQIAQSELERFRTEARTIADLKHPHIVQLIDFGQEEMTPYLVMSYAPHGHLRQQIAGVGAFPLPTVVSWVKQIAAALQFAHDHKIIHRDVKPENILLGEQDELLLSDFGIAFIAQTTHQQSIREVTGTLAYMAPEQAQGKPVPASDQYALGILAYELLTGTRPFQGSFPELLAQHLTASPPPLREKLPMLPLAVEQALLRSLAKKPQDRFPSVNAFAEALEEASMSRDTRTLSTAFCQADASSLLTQQETYETVRQSEVCTGSELYDLAGSLHPVSPHSDASSSDLYKHVPLLHTPLASQRTVRLHQSVTAFRRRFFKYKASLLIVIALALLLIFGGFYTAYNATATIPTQLPPALSVTSNTLYHADWSQGMNGWKGGAEWKWIENGVVGSDGGEGSNYGLLAPYHSMSADYAVEAQVQVIRFTASSSGDVGLLVRADMGENGYFCGIDATRNMMVALVRSGERLLTPLSTLGPKLPPGLQYHLFRVEVRKNIITCFIDGHQAAQAADNDYLTAGMVGLRAVNAVIDVHGFQVLKLQN